MAKGYFNFNKRKKNPERFEKAFATPSVEIPLETFQILKNISEEKAIPVSRLIAIAVDNELDTPSPFIYNCTIPDVPYREHRYLDEGKKIMDFLSKHYPHGASLDTLVLCRRDIGVDDKEILLLAYRELMTVEALIEFRPVRTSFPYDRSYRRVRVSTQEDAEKLK